VRGEREACGRRYDLHAGRGAGNCEHRAILWVEPEDNPMLMPGATYRTPASAPLILEGRRWHDPGARALLGTFALDLEYTHRN
jgi:hypothetical protein